MAGHKAIQTGALSSATRPARKWIFKPEPPESFLTEAQAEGYSPLTARLLYNRNLQTIEAIRYFFNVSYTSLADPFLVKDMDVAVERIRKAISDGEKIAVYGDFDADGVTACSLLIQFFRAVGVEAIPRIPHRVDEGYGLNPSALKRLHEQGVTLVITVDCGVSNHAEVELGRELGMDVIVTDHHRPPESLPAATAILNVRQPGCQYPYKGVAGVGMAFHLVRALAAKGVKADGLKPSDFLDLVALGTVADIAPLTGENRALVASGLKALNKTKRPGIIALVEAAGLKQGELDASAIGFSLAPRINAAGRIDDAVLAYQLLLTGSLDEARQIAEQLNAKNRERQSILNTVLDEARTRVINDGLAQNRKLLLLSGEKWAAGIVGLVAGRLCEEYSRPVVVLERGPEFSRGSARSIYAFNIVDALSECSELLERFGGHRQAAGFTVATARLPELERRLVALAENLKEEDLLPRLEIDTALHPAEIEEAYKAGIILTPFGNENPAPLYASLGLKLREARPVGANGAHLRLRLYDPHTMRGLDGVAFKEGWRAAELKPGSLVDVAFNLEKKEWQGQKQLEVYIRDIRPAQI